MANMDVKRVREDFPILGQQVHGHPLVYLDNSATTQVPEQVLSTVAEHYRTSNPNVHRGMHYLAHAGDGCPLCRRGRFVVRGVHARHDRWLEHDGARPGACARS